MLLTCRFCCHAAGMTAFPHNSPPRGAHRLLLRLRGEMPTTCHIVAYPAADSTAGYYEVLRTATPPGLVDGDIVEVRPDPEGNLQITRLVSLVPGATAHFTVHPEVDEEEEYRGVEELEEFGVLVSEISDGSYFAHLREINSTENARQIIDVILGPSVTVNRVQTQMQRAAALKKNISTQLLPRRISDTVLRSTIGELHDRCRIDLPGISCSPTSGSWGQDRPGPRAA